MIVFTEYLPWLLILAVVAAAYYYRRQQARPNPAKAVVSIQAASAPVYSGDLLTSLFTQALHAAKYEAENRFAITLAEEAAKNAVDRFTAPFAPPAAKDAQPPASPSA